MSSCSLCRVKDTPEHQQSGWHIYNVRINGQGKMPIAEDLYNKFEKNKEDDSATSSAPAVAKSDSLEQKRNVNQWHWEEANYTPWAHKRITELLAAINIPVEDGSITISKIAKISGDAFVNTRKGKTFPGYELKMSLEWSGSLGGWKGEGKASMPEVAIDVSDHKYEVRNIALDGQGGEKPAETKEKLLAVFKKEGVAAIRQQIAVFAAELSGFARDPSSFKHTS